MSNKIFFYYAIILLATVCLIIVPYVALAKESKYTSIKLIIKEQPEVESSIKSVMKKLNELARNMEKTAKLYNTINQKAYWESEGKKSFLRSVVQSISFAFCIPSRKVTSNNNGFIDL